MFSGKDNNKLMNWVKS